MTEIVVKRWKRGLPPGRYYPGMEDDYEVHFGMLGMKHYRQRASADARLYANFRAVRECPHMTEAQRNQSKVLAWGV